MHEPDIYAIVHCRSLARSVGMIPPHGWGPTLPESEAVLEALARCHLPLSYALPRHLMLLIVKHSSHIQSLSQLKL